MRFLGRDFHCDFPENILYIFIVVGFLFNVNQIVFFSLCILWSTANNSLFQLAPPGRAELGCIFKTITLSLEPGSCITITDQSEHSITLTDQSEHSITLSLEPGSCATEKLAAASH